MSSSRYRNAAYIVALICLCLVVVAKYMKQQAANRAAAAELLLLKKQQQPPPVLNTLVKGDLLLTEGGKLSIPLLGSQQTGSLFEIGSDQAIDLRYGLGVYPGQSMRMYAANGADIRLSFAQKDGSFLDSMLVTKDGDVGLGLEPSARLHVGGNMLVNGSLGIGPYMLTPTNKGLQICKNGSACQYLFEVGDEE